VPLINISESLSIWSIGLTSRTTLPTCCANCIVLESRINTWNKQRRDLEGEVLNFERSLISQTLAKVNGKVTHAAELLGVGYQKLAYIIGNQTSGFVKEVDASAPPATEIVESSKDQSDAGVD